MTKIVNIQTTRPIHITRPPLEGNMFKVELKTGDIRHCLAQGARIQEVLANGMVIPLDMTNFNKDHSNMVEALKPVTPKVEESVKTEVKVEQPAVEVKVEEIATVEEVKGVVEEAKMEEALEPNVEEVKEEVVVEETPQGNNENRKNKDKYRTEPKKNY